ncbi:Putative inorganic phosphate cotransporter [Araneus ventricosus]|uniref:Inorganic phosphate cotransporter n=1 Tax=Araneus ventricosus TaxID=182803 RepID=A0A4Y2QSK5_ARAVE|nr:Putative inorganic phosphate cotransporter [Araneus ventricosus]
MSGNLELAVSDSTKTNRRCSLGQRHVVTLFGFLSWFLLSSNRLVLSIGIVAMVKHTQTNETTMKNASDSCPSPATPTKPDVRSNFQGEFDWSPELQGYILGAGFLSYMTTQTTAGRFADAVGAKPLMVFSNALTGILVVLSPLAARWHVYALMAVQFLRGASQGITAPAIYKMISNWIPRTERGTLNSLVSCGYSAGAAVNGIVTGWLCDIPGLGWPSAFYIWGTFSVVIAIVTHFICFEHPVDNPWITDEELKHINDGLETKVSEKKLPTPWKKMFTSIPYYAYCYALLGHMWGINYFTTVHPTFMGTVLHYSMAEVDFRISGGFLFSAFSETHIYSYAAGQSSHCPVGKTRIFLPYNTSTFDKSLFYLALNISYLEDSTFLPIGKAWPSHHPHHFFYQ